MKKVIIFALTLSALVCCFTACGKKIDGVLEITGEDKHTLAVVTQEDGNIKRDDDNNILVVVTDEDGKALTDKDGGNQTEIADLQTAFVYDNRIEFTDYFLDIPKGWSNHNSYSDLIITKDGSDEQIKIIRNDEKSYEEIVDGVKTMFNTVKNTFPEAKAENSSVKIGKEQCNLMSVYIPKAADGNPSYLAYAFLEHDTAVYSFMITAGKDLTEDFDEITEILNSVEFK